MRVLTLTACAVMVVAMVGCISDRGSEEVEASMSSDTRPTSEKPAPESSESSESSERDVTANDAPATEPATNPGTNPPAGSEVATLGAGCFWCIEAVLEQLDGITDVKSGYMGGDVKNPTYRQVCGGTTGHAEVVQVTFDPHKMPYEKLLDHFWKLHDPTTLNRQGNDIGPQYRSAIFYHSEEQRRIAEASKKALDASGMYRNPAVTEITAASTFYEAEDYHQDYYRLNKAEPYCQWVISPKLKKLGLDD